MKKYLLIAALCLALTGCSVPSGDAALTYTAGAVLYVSGWLAGGRRLT